MAYVSKELKAKLAPQIKAVLKKYNLKGSISVEHHSKLVVTVSKGNLDFSDMSSNYMFHYDGYRNGKIVDKNDVRVQFINEMIDAMNGEGTDDKNYDNSDVMTDYFDVGYYIELKIGKWDKPYELIKD